MITLYDYESKVYEYYCRQQVSKAIKENLKLKQTVRTQPPSLLLLVVSEPYEDMINRLSGLPCCLLDISKKETMEAIGSRGIPIMKYRGEHLCEIKQLYTSRFIENSWENLIAPSSARGILLDIDDGANNFSIIDYTFRMNALQLNRCLIIDKKIYPLFSDVQRSKPSAKSNAYALYGGMGDILLQLPYIWLCCERAALNKEMICLYMFNIKYAESCNRLVRYILSDQIEIVSVHLGPCSTKNQLAILENMVGSHYIDMSDYYGKIIQQHSAGSGRVQPHFLEMVSHHPESNVDTAGLYFEFQRAISAPAIHLCSDLHKQYRYVIGMQRVSATDMKQKEAFEYSKIWAEKDAEIFLECCKKNRIAVINFEPSETLQLGYTANFSHMDFLQSYNILKEMDAFVGIDSCFCHMAACLGIPSITLYSSTVLEFNLFSQYFKPPVNNYSLYPVDFERNLLQGEMVFDRLIKILTGKLNLTKHYIPIESRVAYRDYEFV